MLHRHLNHSEWTLAAIDDVIARGRLDDWKQLRDAPHVVRHLPLALILRAFGAGISDFLCNPPWWFGGYFWQIRF